MIFLHLVFVLNGLLLLKGEIDSWDAHDIIGVSDKHKVGKLSLELLQDSKLKLRQIRDIVDEHSVVVAFQIGYILGQIREKYKRMLETYRDARDRYTNRTLLAGPGVRVFKPLHYIISMELVHTKEVDIDKLVSVLESIPTKMMGSKDSVIVIKNSTKLLLRSNEDSAYLALRRQEEELKSKYREQYTMKKLGLMGNDSLTFAL